MPTKKDRFLGGRDLPVTQEARKVAADFLVSENERVAHKATSDQVIGEILSGQRDFAPAVQIAQFTLDAVKKEAADGR